MADLPDVRPGQVWADNDKRSKGRKVRVAEIDETHATVEQVDSRGVVDRRMPVRRTRIRLDRFRPISTGYRLVTDAPDEAAPTSEVSIYLVWSNEHGAWWGPERSGYTGDVWAAGRYDEDAAAQICNTRSWRKAGPPPEVMVLAPENDRDTFTIHDIRAMSDLMQQRIRKATRQRIAERKAAKTSVPA